MGTSESLRTTDLNEARGFLDPRFYSSCLVPVDRESRVAAQMTVTTFPGLTLSEATFGAELRVSFPELDCYHVNVPVAGRLHTRLQARRARVVVPGMVEVYEPHAGQVTDRWSADCRVIGVKIKPGMVHHQLAEMLGVTPAGPVRFRPDHGGSSGPMAGWCRLVRWLQDDAVGPRGLTRHPLFTDRLQELVIGGLLVAMDHQYRTRLDAAAGRPVAPRAIRRVIDAVRERPDRAYTLSSLAAIAGLSPRTLQQGFRRHLDTSPMSFVRDTRLEKAHDALRRGEPPHTTVAEVAHRWGFAHPGRFSQIYRARYGISPSETLRR
jgi:AraC-like DNA-binding protein